MKLQLNDLMVRSECFSVNVSLHFILESKKVDENQNKATFKEEKFIAEEER